MSKEYKKTDWLTFHKYDYEDQEGEFFICPYMVKEFIGSIPDRIRIWARESKRGEWTFDGDLGEVKSRFSGERMYIYFPAEDWIEENIGEDARFNFWIESE